MIRALHPTQETVGWSARFLRNTSARQSQLRSRWSTAEATASSLCSLICW
jgi:hypothetical protein